jgi:hypothetical protein
MVALASFRLMNEQEMSRRNSENFVVVKIIISGNDSGLGLRDTKRLGYHNNEK